MIGDSIVAALDAAIRRGLASPASRTFDFGGGGATGASTAPALSVPPAGGATMSAAGRCLRRRFFDATDPIREERAPEEIVGLRFGDAGESILFSALAAGGTRLWWPQGMKIGHDGPPDVLLPAADGRPEIAGHVDALADVTVGDEAVTVLLECKATNESSFERRASGEGTEADETQARLYLHAIRSRAFGPSVAADGFPEVVGAALVYLNRGAKKGSAAWSIGWIEQDDAAAAEILGSYADVAAWAAHWRETGELMPIPEGMAPHRFPCATVGKRGRVEWCPRAGRCWPRRA